MSLYREVMKRIKREIPFDSDESVEDVLNKKTNTELLEHIDSALDDVIEKYLKDKEQL